MSKQIEYELDARKKFKNGVDREGKAMVVTLRHRGKNVVFEKMDGSPQMSCNGVNQVETNGYFRGQGKPTMIFI